MEVDCSEGEAVGDRTSQSRPPSSSWGWGMVDGIFFSSEKWVSTDRWRWQRKKKGERERDRESRKVEDLSSLQCQSEDSFVFLTFGLSLDDFAVHPVPELIGANHLELVPGRRHRSRGNLAGLLR